MGEGEVKAMSGVPEGGEESIIPTFMSYPALTFFMTTGHLELLGHLTGAYSQSFSWSLVEFTEYGMVHGIT